MGMGSISNTDIFNEEQRGSPDNQDHSGIHRIHRTLTGHRPTRRGASAKENNSFRRVSSRIELNPSAITSSWKRSSTVNCRKSGGMPTACCLATPKAELNRICED